MVPNRALKHDEEMLAAADAYLKTKAHDAYCVIKVHIPLNENPNLKVVYMTRDLRDQIFSSCRFENRLLTEQSALEMVAYSMGMDFHYEQWPPSKILRVSFDSLENDSTNLIQRIADFMKLPEIDIEDIHEIDAKLSKNQVRKKIADVDTVFFGDPESHDEHSLSSVRGGSGITRAHDDATGFQSGHVSDYRSGDWKQLWTDQEKQIVDDAIRIVQQKERSTRRKAWQSLRVVTPILPHIAIRIFQRPGESFRVR